MRICNRHDFALATLKKVLTTAPFLKVSFYWHDTYSCFGLLA